MKNMENVCHSCSYASRKSQISPIVFFKCSNYDCQKEFCSQCVGSSFSTPFPLEEDKVNSWICLVCEGKCKCNDCRLKAYSGKMKKMRTNSQSVNESSMNKSMMDEFYQVEHIKKQREVAPVMQKILRRKNHIYNLILKKEEVQINVKQLVINTIKSGQYEKEDSVFIIEDTGSQ